MLDAVKYDTICAFSNTGEVKMAQTAFSIRMDEDLKRDFSEFCNDIGMSMTTAFVIFAKETLREQQIPFGVGRKRRCATDIERRARRCMDFLEDFRAEKEANGWPDMTMEEIDAEIAAARRERRERKARKESVAV